MMTRPVFSRPGLRLTTGHSPQRRRAMAAILGVGLAGTLALAGCSQGASPAPKSVVAAALPGEHVHGISRDPGSSKVSRDKAGVLEILVATDKGVVQSRDHGATVTDLTS